MVRTEIDEAFVAFHEHLLGIMVTEGQVEDPMGTMSLKIESVTLDMPVQFDVIDSEGTVMQLGSAPPLYYIHTSIMPVFHQVRITLEPEYEKRKM